jgi:hypothetical protein
MKSIVRDIYPPNGNAELTRATVLPRRVAGHKISYRDRQRAWLQEKGCSYTEREHKLKRG